MKTITVFNRLALHDKPTNRKCMDYFEKPLNHRCTIPS